MIDPVSNIGSTPYATAYRSRQIEVDIRMHLQDPNKVIVLCHPNLFILAQEKQLEIAQIFGYGGIISPIPKEVTPSQPDKFTVDDRVNETQEPSQDRPSSHDDPQEKKRETYRSTQEWLAQREIEDQLRHGLTIDPDAIRRLNLWY